MHEKKVVVITGGAKGIGKAIATAYCRKGYHVVVLGRDEKALKTTSSELARLGCSIHAMKADVGDAAECSDAVAAIIADHGTIDVLVLNAGVSMRGTVEATSIEVAEKIMRTNFFGSLNMIKPALPALRESKGSIVFISSIMALRGLPFTSYYGASKAAIKVLSESMRCELAHTGIHIGIVHVGMTRNEPQKRVFAPDGSSIALNERKKAATRKSVADKVVACSEKRIAEMTLTPIGKLAGFLYRHFPRLSRYVTGRFSTVTRFYR